MKRSLSRSAIQVIALALLFAVSQQSGAEQAGMRQPSPESVGFSRERLQRLDVVMQRLIDEGQFAGVVTLVARHGRVVHFNAVGKRDLASGAPLEEENIFRIFSMSKPITAAAMMVLYEEGRWTPQDPLARFIPQWRDLKVYAGMSPSGSILLESPKHPPTMFELMTMTAGFSFGREHTAADRFYRGQNGEDIFLSGSLQAVIDRLSRAPLLYQPGSAWKYGLSVDIQGYLIEQLTGMTLPQFLRTRLFEPLEMEDTAFCVPDAKRGRLAALYRMGEAGTLITTDPPSWNQHKCEPAALPLGGSGLVSTAKDYFRFAQMLLNGGALDGVRVLSPAAVELMISNNLPENLQLPFAGGGNEFIKPRPGVGYGFNGAVISDPALAAMPLGAGSYLWDGAGGTWFWVDPVNDIVVVGMAQRMGWGVHQGVQGLPPNLGQLSMGVIYQSLLWPER